MEISRIRTIERIEEERSQQYKKELYSVIASSQKTKSEKTSQIISFKQMKENIKTATAKPFKNSLEMKFMSKAFNKKIKSHESVIKHLDETIKKLDTSTAEQSKKVLECDKKISWCQEKVKDINEKISIDKNNAIEEELQELVTTKTLLSNVSLETTTPVTLGDTQQNQPQNQQQSNNFTEQPKQPTSHTFDKTYEKIIEKENSLNSQLLQSAEYSKNKDGTENLKIEVNRNSVSDIMVSKDFNNFTVQINSDKTNKELLPKIYNHLNAKNLTQIKVFSA